VGSPNNITVKILFENMTSGLGDSRTGLYGLTYYQYYNAYKNVATSATQLTALASLGKAPGPHSGNPVNGQPYIWVTSAEARNLGYNAPGVMSGGYDTIIGLNTSITNPPHSGSSYYGLQSVANHEIDEALGIGGTGSMLGQGYPLNRGVGDLDLYRYAANGIRSFTTNQRATSYFSIDGGKTVLSYFNQLRGADYADWASDPIPVGFGPQVQDAFGEPGTNPALGSNELTALNVIGYQLTNQSSMGNSSVTSSGGVIGNATAAVPEPASTTLLTAGALFLTGYGCRRRKREMK
jgi:hypothetical protein